MEFPNFSPHHQLQEQLSGGHPPPNIVSSSHELNPTISLNDDTNNMYQTKYLPNYRNSRSNYHTLGHSIGTPTGSNFGFADPESYSDQQSTNELLARIKEETSDTFPRLSDVIRNPSNVGESHLLSSINSQQFSSDPSTSIWINNLSTGRLAGDFYPAAQEGASSSRFTANHVFPNTNFSASSISPPFFPPSLGLNLQTLDLLASSSYGTGSGQYSLDKHDLLRASLSSGIDQHLQASRNRSLYPSNNSSVLTNATTTIKRATNLSTPKESHTEAKRPRSSCPPLKVRKEKLGDRIAALQRLVAPFGKTDTASVLTEAIGYIQFLHDQIQTLSVPYMKSTHGKPSRTIGAGSSKEGGREEPKRDLKSRGLCLVPVSFASYINNYE